MTKHNVQINLTYSKTLGIICFLASFSTSAENFSAPLLSADWNINSGKNFCQIRHEIPAYGIAFFVHKSGELLRFSIKENRFKVKPKRASLSINSAPWNHQSIPQKDYFVTLELNLEIQNYPRLSVFGNTAEIMLDALSNGYYPTFTYLTDASNSQSTETNVAISSINFSKIYQQFNTCRVNFLPHRFKKSLQKSLFFNAASKQFSSEVLKQLENTVRYLEEIENSSVVIVSDTAIAGNRDKKWFLRRANLIVEKLIALGIPKNNIVINKGLNTNKKENDVVQLSIFGPDALKSIYYRKGNTKLTPTEKKRLALLAKYANEFRPDSTLVIKSHTDSKGKRARNLAISRERGNVIKRFLLSQGMHKNKVQVKAYGESRPAKSNRFPIGRAQNRRVFIEIVS